MEMANQELGEFDFVEVLGGDQGLGSEEFIYLLRQVKFSGDEFFSDLLYLITHRRFPAQDAKRFWNNILKQKKILTEKLGRNPGIRMAALDYLSNIQSILTRPVILDRADFSEMINRSIATFTSRTLIPSRPAIQSWSSLKSLV